MPAVDVAHTVTGEGPPLYLVHGIGSRKSTWDALLPVLSEHFTCVAYDLRGHGESPVPPVPYSLDELVADLEPARSLLWYAAHAFDAELFEGAPGAGDAVAEVS